MDKFAFTNRVRSLYNINKDKIDTELIILGQGPLDMHYWNQFRADPPRFFINTDEPTREAIFRCVEARQ